MIEAREICKSFGAKKVLDGVTFRIDKGSIFGLVGINGSGKSTLLRTLSGIYPPDGGVALIDGKESFSSVEARREIFFLNDDPYYPKRSNVASLKEFYSSFYPAFDGTYFQKILTELKLEANGSIDKFSKGMKRQLFIAIALATRPQYLLLDEAFDGLDPLARLLFKRELIQEVEDRKMSAIIASHNLRELSDIADTFGLLDQGKVLDCGNISDKTEEINKYQLAFSHDVIREDFTNLDLISFKKVGKVVTVLIRGQVEPVKERLSRLDPVMMETIPISFEELFILEVQKKGYLYDFQEIL
jgi:ABC-2 type transport system ATP-binding protein